MIQPLLCLGLVVIFLAGGCTRSSISEFNQRVAVHKTQLTPYRDAKSVDVARDLFARRYISPKPILTEADVEHVYYIRDARGRHKLSIVLTPKGQEKLGSILKSPSLQQVAITLDGDWVDTIILDPKRSAPNVLDLPQPNTLRGRVLY